MIKPTTCLDVRVMIAEKLQDEAININELERFFNFKAKDKSICLVKIKRGARVPSTTWQLIHTFLKEELNATYRYKGRMWEVPLQG